MSATIGELLDAQDALQREAFNLVPSGLTGDERADFITWNVTALTDELHEALQEVSWKPWVTTGRGVWIDRDAYVKELVDALHFLLNLFLVANVSGEELTARYLAKREVNAARQRDGYDGKKDDEGRATDEPELPAAVIEHMNKQKENGYA